MPRCGLVIPFFVVFGGSTVRARRKFVLLGGFSVCLVHVVPSREKMAGKFCTASARILATRCGLWQIGAGFAGRRNILRARAH
jgi:hypothetical protein